jgi:probable HAF family extracellular repeat protein
MFRFNHRFIYVALLILGCILPAAGQVQPCQQGTLANVLGTSCSVDHLILNFQTFFDGGFDTTQDGVSSIQLITPADIGFIPVQVNGQSGYKLVLNFATGPGTNSTFVGNHLVQFGYTPQSIDGFEIRAVELQLDGTAQAPPQGTAIADVLDFQNYPNTGFQATDAAFAIDPSFTFPPDETTNHVNLEFPSTLSTGSIFAPFTTQISDFVLGTGSTTMTSATFLFQMEPILPPPPPAPLTYTNIDLPSASSTIASNLNNHGQVVGSFVDSLGTQHAFVTEKRGGFTTIDFPGAVSTSGFGINNQGDVVGSYTDAAGATHGFLLSQGNLSTFDPPGSTFTLAFGINDRGQIVGQYDPGFGPVPGFLFADGQFTDINQGQVQPSSGFTFTEAIGINNRGEIVGDDFDPNMFRSFIGSNNVFQGFEVPSQGDTFMGGINEPGDYVGSYFDINFGLHGFLNTQGNFLTLDFPGAFSTFALGTNAAGSIVGVYDNGDGVRHSFLAQPGAGNSADGAPSKPATLKHAPDKPVCGSAEWRRQAQSGLRPLGCQARH